VARLQAAELVERGKSSHDSREAQIRLSTQGSSVHAQLSQAAGRRNALLLEGFTGEEARLAFDVLDRLIASAETQLNVSD
jgi:DNA-binding MarR family transcriptional regulator